MAKSRKPPLPAALPPRLGAATRSRDQRGSDEASRSRSESEAPVPSASFWTAPGWRLPAAIALLVALAFANGIYGQFLYDDVSSIVDDAEIKDLFDPARIARINPRRAVVYYSFALNWAYAGADPLPYHVVNILIHVAATLALYGLVRRSLLTWRLAPRFAAAAPWLAAAVALAWGLHPLQTQSVTYIVQRTESLMGLCFLATLYFTARGATGEPTSAWRWYLGAALCCWLGMFSKEVMIVAPVVLLLYDFAILSQSRSEPFARRWGLHLACCAAIVPLVLLTADASAKSSLALGRNGATISSVEFAQTQPEVILHYLRLAFWPDALCLDYHWPIERDPTVIAATGAVVAALFLASVALLFYSPPLGFVCLWFFLTLAPSSSVLPIVDLAFEHRTYLALASPVVLTILGGWRLWERLVSRNPVLERVRIAAPATLLLVIVSALGTRTIVRNFDYWSVERMWRTVAEISPDNPRAHHNIGVELVQSGRTADALPYYEKAVELGDPNRDGATAQYHRNLGIAYASLGRPADAAREFSAAVQLAPDSPEAHWSLGMALSELNRRAEAIASLQQALQLDPALFLARNRLAELLVSAGDYAAARGHAEQVLRADPQRASAYIAWAEAALGLSDFPAARKGYEAALRAAPGDRETTAEYAWLLAACPDDSVRDSSVALRAAQAIVASRAANASPDAVVVLAQMTAAAALADQGRFDEAVAAADSA
ncbi:MAG TPA: tetratricopeptide repeat protein, partial [Pirellulales bacterium]